MRPSVVIITVIGVLIVAIIIFKQAWETIERPVERVWDVDNLTLKDFAYVEGAKTPHKVFIEENGELAPYLVLTDNYNGNCLLLREYVLNEPRIYNKKIAPLAYYNGSDIDNFVNNTFIKTLSNGLSEAIVNTDIVITAAESLGIGGNAVETINRKVFLLSYTEINRLSESELKKKGGMTTLKEGESLLYFQNAESRIATTENGKTKSWMIRTPSTASTDSIYVVINDGWVGLGSVSTIAGEGEDGGVLLGVRPAFCLPGDMKVTKTVNEDGEKYVLQ